MLREPPQGKKIKKLIFCYVILVCSFGLGQELSQINGRVENESTSDKFYRTSEYLSWKNHRRQMNWNFEGEAEEALDYGVELDVHNGEAPGLTYAGQRLGFFVARKFSPRLYVSSEAGIHRVAGTGTMLDKSIMVLGAAVEWLPSEEWQFEIPVRQDLVYMRALPAGATDGVSEISCDPNFTYRPFEKLRLVSRNQYRWLSDGNRKRENDVSLLYGISTSEYWIWLGMGVDYIEFTKRNTGYYSPERFYSWGPRFEAAFPVWQEFSAVGAYSHNTFQEDNLAWGSGHYSSFAIRHGDRNHLLLELQAVQIRSAQGSTAWTSNQYAFSLAYSH